jgi:hypothetical protein
MLLFGSTLMHIHPILCLVFIAKMLVESSMASNTAKEQLPLGCPLIALGFVPRLGNAKDLRNSSLAPWTRRK